MAPVFSKEAVLAGSIDHLCLACESYLRTEAEVLQHVGTAGHRANFDSTHYVDKYKEDRVRKVKKWYFCEFCNVLVSTIATVGLHVGEPRHTENKLSQMISRVGDFIVYRDITIQHEAWHGLIGENTCTVCSVEYEDKAAHMSESTHVVNLIQRKVQDANSNIYRKIDDSTFHCLTCNEVIVDITQHLDEPKHKELLNNCIKRMPAIKEESSKYENSDILDSITKFQKDKINVNLESRTAVCKKCTKNLEFNCKAIENHIEEHKKNVEIKEIGTTPKLLDKSEKKRTRDSEKLFTCPVFRNKEAGNTEKQESNVTETTQQEDRDNNILRNMAEEHSLTYMSNGNKVYCGICYKKIPSSVSNIKEHVNGELHKNNSRLHSQSNVKVQTKDKENLKQANTKKCNFLKVPTKKFIKTLVKVENEFGVEMIINDKYCINSLSFTLLTIVSPVRLRCQVCEINILYQDIKDHVDIARHNETLKALPIIIYNDTEFIREIRSGSYHCGYCNFIDSWEGMEHHLKSTDHKECKTVLMRRLAECQTLMRRDHLEREIRNALLMNLFFQ